MSAPEDRHDSAHAPAAHEAPKPPPWRAAAEMALIVAGAVALAMLVQAFVVKPFRIPSRSMEPTLTVNERILVDRVSTRLGLSTPKRGQVVVFNPPENALQQRCLHPEQGSGTPTPCAVASKTKASTTFVKRIVGLPGERLSMRQGRIYINGKLLDAPYNRPCPPNATAQCDFPDEIIIPEGHYYLIGDNRAASDDSRFWGPVPKDWLLGEVIASYWPPNRIGLR